MTKHCTKAKGDLATTAAIFDLTKKDHHVFVPVAEHLPLDLVVLTNSGKFLKVQCKHSVSGVVKDGTGPRNRKYKKDDFDYFALYLPSLDRVVYPAFSFMGAKIALSVPNSATPFYWWEDFTDFTDVAVKRTFRDFGIKITHPNSTKIGKCKLKGAYPADNELKEMVFQRPIREIGEQIGVSGRAISKYCKVRGIELPDRGYWLRATDGGARNWSAERESNPQCLATLVLQTST